MLSDALINRLDWPFVLRSTDHQVVMQWAPESGFSSGGWRGKHGEGGGQVRAALQLIESVSFNFAGDLLVNKLCSQTGLP